MKEKVKGGLISLLFVGLAACLAAGCDNLSEKDGYIDLRFDRESVSMLNTKGTVSVPDTADFVLTITNSAGVAVYSGSYSERPSELAVPSGTYAIEVVSAAFDVPKFDTPVYGDSQTIAVTAGEHVSVDLECSRINSGLRIQFTERFKKKFADYIMTLSSTKGTLDYGFTETGTAYFMPEDVSYNAKSGLTSVLLFKRSLEAGKVLTIKLDATSTETTGTPLFKIYVDTSAVYVSETLTYDEENGSADGKSKATAYTVSQSRQHIGEIVWVHGYVVGGDLSTSGTVTFATPFTKDTHIAIASSSSESASANCMSVQLPSGDIRTAVNLKDNPGNLGNEIWVYGTIVAAYFKLVGINPTSQYSF
jgi:hypothetical protein